MTGGVTGRHALLPVMFRLQGRPDLTIEFVVDTGFTYFLTLPPAERAARFERARARGICEVGILAIDPPRDW